MDERKTTVCSGWSDGNKLLNGIGALQIKGTKNILLFDGAEEQELLNTGIATTPCVCKIHDATLSDKI